MDTRMRRLSEAEYPARLFDLNEASRSLYVVGELPRTRAVAIVGTRHASPEGIGFARTLACELAEAGIAVLSGGAVGIDAAAHEGALDGKGSTVVVAPAAFDRAYPEENGELFSRIVRSGGAYLTMYPSGTPAAQPNFFVRNSHLVALSDAVVVVEAGFRSGARNAAKAARTLSRPLFVVPGAPWAPTSSGCLAEMRLGAAWIGSSRDLLVALGLEEPEPESAVRHTSERQLTLEPVRGLPQSCSGDPEPLGLIKSLGAGPKTLDELCSERGLTPGRLQALILTLTLEGIVVSDPSGLVRLRNI